MPRFLFFHQFPVITSSFYYNVDSYGGVMDSSILNVYPVYSAHHPLDVWFAFVASTAGVYFGGDKQV